MTFDLAEILLIAVCMFGTGLAMAGAFLTKSIIMTVLAFFVGAAALVGASQVVYEPLKWALTAIFSISMAADVIYLLTGVENF